MRKYVFLFLLIPIKAYAGVMSFLDSLFQDLKDFLGWIVFSIFEALWYWISVIIFKLFDILFLIYDSFSFSSEFSYFRSSIQSAIPSEFLVWVDFYHIFGMLELTLLALPARMLVRKFL